MKVLKSKKKPKLGEYEVSVEARMILTYKVKANSAKDAEAIVLEYIDDGNDIESENVSELLEYDTVSVDERTN